MRYRLMASYLGASYQAAVGPSDRDVTLFAAPPPPEEHGFSPDPGGIWRKQVRLDDLDGLWESRPIGSYHGEPCLVLDDLGDRLHIVYLGMDERRAAQLGYWEVDRGVFEVVVARHDVTDLAEERHEFPIALLLSALPRALGAGDSGGAPGSGGLAGHGGGPNGNGSPNGVAGGNAAAAGNGGALGNGAGQAPAAAGWNGQQGAPQPVRGQLPPGRPAQLPAAPMTQPPAAAQPQMGTGTYQVPPGGMPQNGLPGMPGVPAMPGAPGGTGVSQPPGQPPAPPQGPPPASAAQAPIPAMQLPAGPGLPAAQPPMGPQQVAAGQQFPGAPALPAAQQAPGVQQAVAPQPQTTAAQATQPPTAVAAWHGSPAPDGNGAWYYQNFDPQQNGAAGNGVSGNGLPVNGIAPNGYAQPDQGLPQAAPQGGPAGTPQYAQPAQSAPGNGYQQAQPLAPAVGAQHVQLGQPAAQVAQAPQVSQQAPPQATLSQAPSAVPASATQLAVAGPENVAVPAGGQMPFGQPAAVMPTAPLSPQQATGPQVVAPPLAAPLPPPPTGPAVPVSAMMPAPPVTTQPPTTTQPLPAPQAMAPATVPTTPLAAPAAGAGATGPLAPLPPVSRPTQPSSSGLTPGGALSKLTGAVRGRRAKGKPRLAMSSIFAELVDMADIPRSAYAVDDEVTGAMCLFKTDGGYEVFSCAEDARHEVRFFEEEEAAYFYLFGVLAAEALRNGRLSPRRG